MENPLFFQKSLRLWSYQRFDLHDEEIFLTKIKNKCKVNHHSLLGKFERDESKYSEHAKIILEKKRYAGCRSIVPTCLERETA